MPRDRMAKITWTLTAFGYDGVDARGGRYTIRCELDAISKRRVYILREPDYRLGGLDEPISSVNARDGVRHPCRMRTVAEAKNTALRGAP